MGPMPRSPLFLARAVVVVLAIAALALVAVAGPGTRAGWWSWEFGISFIRYGTYLGLAAALGASILLVTLIFPAYRVRPWVPLAALVIGIASAAPGVLMI